MQATVRAASAARFPLVCTFVGVVIFLKVFVTCKLSEIRPVFWLLPFSGSELRVGSGFDGSIPLEMLPVIFPVNGADLRRLDVVSLSSSNVYIFPPGRHDEK